MGTKDFYRLVLKYENESKKSPNLYRLKVLAIALGGYLVICGIVLAITAGLVLSALSIRKFDLNWINGSFLVLFLGLIIPCARCLFSPRQSPGGIELPPGQFPWLYQQLAMLRKPMKTGLKKIHLMVDWEFNASAIHLRKFGFFGPKKYYIKLGLPLLAICNAAQLRSVMAHELAHFSRQQTFLNNWIWKVRLMWIQFLAALEGKRFTGWIFRWFANWYSSYFEAAANVQRRQFEFEADKLAAEAVGVESCVETLLRIDSRIEKENQYWQELWRKPFSSTQVDKAPVTSLLRLLESSQDFESHCLTYKTILGNHTLFYDTHPATADRIKSLGVQVPERDSEIRAFIERYNIGESSSILRQALGFDTRRTEMFLDGIWGFVNDLLWKIRNVEGEGLRTALERIEKEENYRKEGLGTEKMWRKASLVAELNGLDEALPIVKSILEISPNHAGANYLMGQLMVEKFDPTGIVYIETAIENDPLSYQLEGLLALSDIYRRLGNIRESEETFTRIFSVGEAYDKAVTERDKPIRFFNQFAPHSLTDDQIEDFCYTFAGVSSIKKVYAVRKMVDHIPETPYHVLIVVPTLKGAIDLANTIKAVEKTFAFSGSLAFVVAGPLRKPLLWKASTKPNSLIYDQNSSDRFKYTMD